MSSPTKSQNMPVLPLSVSVLFVRQTESKYMSVLTSNKEISITFKLLPFLHEIGVDTSHFPIR